MERIYEGLKNAVDHPPADFIIPWVAIFVDKLMDGNPTSTRAAVA